MPAARRGKGCDGQRLTELLTASSGKCHVDDRGVGTYCLGQAGK